MRLRPFALSPFAALVFQEAYPASSVSCFRAPLAGRVPDAFAPLFSLPPPQSIRFFCTGFGSETAGERNNEGGIGDSAYITLIVDDQPFPIPPRLVRVQYWQRHCSAWQPQSLRESTSLVTPEWRIGRLTCMRLHAPSEASLFAG